MAFQQFGDLAQQQPARRARAGGIALELVVQARQGVLVAGQVEQAGTVAEQIVVLRPPRQHLGGAGRVAEGLVFAGQRRAHLPRAPRLRFQPGQLPARLVQLAALAQQLRAHQADPRLVREALDDPADDAIHQLRLLQPLGQPAEAEPRRQLAREQVAGDDLLDHRHHQFLLLADRAHQRRQRMRPAVLFGQQRAQFAPRLALVAVAQGKPGGDHALGVAGVGRQPGPGVVGVAGQGVVVGEQGDAGGTLGQHRIVGGAGRFEITAGGLRQLPGLQGEFAGQAGFQRIDRRGCGRRGLRGAGAGQQQWQEQARNGAFRTGHRAGRYTMQSGLQLSAGA